MASTFTTNFGFEEIATGEQSGTWGTTTNFNLDILDRIASYKAVGLSGTTHTLTVREASPGQGTENLQDGMYRVIKFTGALGANNTVTVAPNTAATYFIFENATTDSGSSGPYSVIISQGTGANVTIENGKSAIVYCDGAGSGAAVTNALNNLQVASLTVDGDATIGDDLTLISDASVLGFGVNTDVTLTHVHDTGLLLNSSMQLQFSDASQNINAPSATVLDINATDEIELNATLADVNANLDVSGTYQGGGTMTTGGDIVIPNAGNIGSASDTDAIAIASGGIVTFSQVPVFPDDTVETADIQDNAVTLAKMASGTDGNIISYDASGNPVAIATGSDGQVLTSAGAGAPPAFEDSSSGSASCSVTVFTSSDTWSKPSNLLYAIIEVQGGGGGGGGTPNPGSDEAGAGSGGGAGGYARKLLLTAALGSTETVTVGGTAAGGSSSNGTAGNASTFAVAAGTDIVGNGGSGGQSAAPVSTIAREPGIAGGGATGGDINMTGSGSEGSWYMGGTILGTNQALGVASSGGASYFGGAPLSRAQESTEVDGADGAQGSGGSGGASGDTGGAATGGVGGAGLVIVTQYLSA